MAVETNESLRMPTTPARRNHKFRIIHSGIADPLASSKLAGLIYISGEDPGILRKRRGKSFYYVRGDAEVKDRATLKRIRSLVIPPA